MKNSVRDIIASRNQKIMRIIIGFFLFTAIILARLFYLQVQQRAVLRAMGQNNFLRTEVILPLRGNLLDCNGELLASNRPVYNLYWQGGVAQKLTNYHIALLKKLETIIEVCLTDEENIKLLYNAEKCSCRGRPQGRAFEILWACYVDHAQP